MREMPLSCSWNRDIAVDKNFKNLSINIPTNLSLNMNSNVQLYLNIVHSRGPICIVFRPCTSHRLRIRHTYRCIQQLRWNTENLETTLSDIQLSDLIKCVDRRNNVQLYKRTPFPLPHTVSRTASLWTKVPTQFSSIPFYLAHNVSTYMAHCLYFHCVAPSQSVYIPRWDERYSRSRKRPTMQFHILRRFMLLHHWKWTRLEVPRGEATSHWHGVALWRHGLLSVIRPSSWWTWALYGIMTYACSTHGIRTQYFGLISVGRGHLGVSGMNGRIILKWIVSKWGRRLWTRYGWVFQCWALVNMTVNHVVPQKAGNFVNNFVMNFLRALMFEVSYRLNKL
jgi:hypothetical protein